MSDPTCNDVRAKAFEYRRGDLPPAEARELDEHLLDCSACCDYVERMSGMLDRAHEQPAEQWIPDLDTDQLFARIESALGTQDHPDIVGPAIPVHPAQPKSIGASAHDDLAANDVPAQGRDGGRRRLIALAFAAALLGAIGGAVGGPAISRALGLGQGDNNGAVELGETLANADAGTEQLDTQPVPDEGDTTHIQPPSQLAAVEQGADTPDAIHVFADPGAVWSVAGEDAYVLNVETGVVLVEFLPTTNNQSLRVTTHDTTIDVVGTVFYVDADEDEVGVVLGAVEVRDTPDAPVLRLGSGARFRAGAVEGLDEADATVAADRIDLVAHAQALTTGPRVNRPGETEPATPAHDVIVDDTGDPSEEIEPEVSATNRLRAEADDALRDGRHSGAARSLELLLRELPSGSSDHGTVQLELAQLYARRLGRESRAIEHLRSFLERHASDSAAGAARRDLCALLGDDAASDPVCAP